MWESGNKGREKVERMGMCPHTEVALGGHGGAVLAHHLGRGVMRSSDTVSILMRAGTAVAAVAPGALSSPCGKARPSAPAGWCPWGAKARLVAGRLGASRDAGHRRFYESRRTMWG